jgi:hypothetical protein
MLLNFKSVKLLSGEKRPFLLTYALLLSIICFPGITSCVKEVNIPVEAMESRLVLKCLFDNNSKFNVRLSQSVPAIKNINALVSGATVILRCDDQVADTLEEIQPGIYQSNIFAEFGKNYQITSSANGFETITSAISYLPEKCIIISAQITDSVAADETEIVSEIKIQFNDLPEYNDFYDIKVSYINDEDTTNIRFYRGYYADIGKEPVLINEGLLKYYPSSLIFSDALFNGETYTLIANPTYREYDVMIILRHITMDYYNYLKTLTYHINSVDYSLWGSAEPINVRSNIENGFGIFAGYSSDTIYIIRDENH